MKRQELVAWLDTFLDIGGYDDASLNGLQVEGVADVNKVAVAVDASLSTFQQATELGADMLIVHHGLFWGPAVAVTGAHRRRIRHLLDHNLNLYAAHLPLDAHREVGNNYGLAHLLDLGNLSPFGNYKGRPIGVQGSFGTAIGLRELADHIETTLGESVLVHAAGPDPVATLGIISGSAAWEAITAAEHGIDAFLTGEPKHDVFHHVFEAGINVLYAGHYMTETVGVNLLARKLEQEFELDTEFILLPTGL